MTLGLFVRGLVFFLPTTRLLLQSGPATLAPRYRPATSQLSLPHMRRQRTIKHHSPRFEPATSPRPRHTEPRAFRSSLPIISLTRRPTPPQTPSILSLHAGHELALARLRIHDSSRPLPEHSIVLAALRCRCRCRRPIAISRVTSTPTPTHARFVNRAYYRLRSSLPVFALVARPIAAYACL